MRWMEGGLHRVSQGPQEDSAIGGSELWADSQALPGAPWSVGADSPTIKQDGVRSPGHQAEVLSFLITEETQQDQVTVRAGAQLLPGQ